VNPRSLTGTVALIAGATGSAGEATARALARAGAAVGLLAETPARLDAIVEEITASGGTAIAAGCDVTNPEATEHAVAQLVARLGRLDILIDNAGVIRFGEVEEMRTAEWQRMLQVNLAGAFHLTGAAVPHLLAAADGPAGVADVIALGSVPVRDAAGAAVHRATQDGLRAFTRELRRELASRHIRVGLVESDFIAATLLDDDGHTLPEPVAPEPGAVPTIRPEQVADAVCYLLTRPPELAVSELRIERAA
jgi:NADP-dependent 3-hydroxy acid dehydrogenase YdfG